MHPTHPPCLRACKHRKLLFNFSSFFPGESAGPICPYVRTPMNWRVVVAQGSVVIEDGAPNAETILIDVEKRGESRRQTDAITVDQTLFDVGHGTIFVIQLVGA